MGPGSLSSAKNAVRTWENARALNCFRNCTDTVTGEAIQPPSAVDRSVPTTEGNAVRENAPRTDNQSGPVA